MPPIAPRNVFLVTLPRRLAGPAIAVILAVVAGSAASPALAAVTPTTAAPSSQADLEARLQSAQAAANQAATRFQLATARHEALVDQIAAVETRIGDERARVADLRSVAQRRALSAYKRRDSGTDAAGAILGGGDLLSGIRRTTLLQHANASDDAAIGSLRALDEDLGVQRSDLARKRDDAAKVLAQVESEKATLEAAVGDAQKVYDELMARLAREASARAAAEQAARRAAATSRPPVGAGTPVGGFLCPVHGPFTDDFGDARSGGRSHQGIDIFAPSGTPVVAVKSGSLSLQSGGNGGNMAYVSAADGNTYFYAHFSSYAGGARPVTQGEVIGYVGMTGDATTPHLHFEIRTGAGVIDPYPTLVSAC